MKLARIACAVVGLTVATVAVARPNKYEMDLRAQLLTVTLQVESCKQLDEIIRKTCARIGSNAPTAARDSCVLPPGTFDARVARSYATFKQTYREDLKRDEADLERAVAQMRESYERQYGHLRSGSFAVHELESLAKERRRCTALETDWPSAPPKGK